MTGDTVLFNSWSGRYSDSPRAIAEELRRRGPALREVWLVGDDGPETPEGVERVPPKTGAAVAALESARWIVSNDVLPVDFAKRPDATYLQTWHGTPLKRIAFDVVNPAFPGADHHYAVELGRDVAKWDLLLSPNPFSTPVLRQAFRFGRPILETGLPRNDAMLAPDRDAVRARVREALAIPDGARALLYAPTWRDSFEYSLALDVEAMEAALGEAWVVLVRAHGLTAATAALDDTPGLRHVTHWPDIGELYLACDALLTDYSSAMFDFAITGKPQLFFTYDLEDYRDRIRGFYFDFEAEAPGPLLRTTGEVITALRDLDAVTAAHTDAYAAFAARYCPHDDGRAAARVVDAVFGTQGA